MVFICNAHEDPAVAATYVDQLMAKQVDGIIVVGTLLEGDPALGEGERPAMVSVDAPGASGSSVGFDLEGSQYAATRHLIDHGHERHRLCVRPRGTPQRGSQAPSPEDIALVGNDDIEMAAVIRPALTTVALPVEVAGRRAVAMMQELITGNQPDPSQVVLDVELVVRRSCGCPGGNDTSLP